MAPFGESESSVRNSGLALLAVGNPYRLGEPEPTAAMLEACVGGSPWTE